MALDRNAVRASAAICTVGKDDCQLAFAYHRPTSLEIERGVDAHTPRETTELPLDNVKRLRRTCDGRRLLPGNQDDASTKHDSKRLRRNSRGVHDDFDSVVGFKDIERGVTFTGGRALLGSQRGCQLVEDCADVFSEFADFRGRNMGDWRHGASPMFASAFAFWLRRDRSAFAVWLRRGAGSVPGRRA